MNKIIFTSIILVSLTWIEIVKSDNYNDFFNLLDNLKVSSDCRAKIYQGRKSCKDKVIEDNGKQVKLTCCSAWTGRDCLTDLVSKCNSTEKGNFSKNFERITQNMERGQCRDYAYHSNECSGSEINMIDNTDVDNLKNSLDKVNLSDKCQAKYKAGNKECFQKIKNYFNSNSITMLLDDLKKAGDKDKAKIKDIEKPLGYLKCYAADDGRDCVMNSIPLNDCSLKEKFDFWKVFEDSKIIKTCSDFKRSPNGSAHISVNSTLFGLTLLYLIYNLW